MSFIGMLGTALVEGGRAATPFIMRDLEEKRQMRLMKVRNSYAQQAAKDQREFVAEQGKLDRDSRASAAEKLMKVRNSYAQQAAKDQREFVAEQGKLDRDSRASAAEKSLKARIDMWGEEMKLRAAEAGIRRDVADAQIMQIKASLLAGEDPESDKEAWQFFRSLSSGPFGFPEETSDALATYAELRQGIKKIHGGEFDHMNFLPSRRRQAPGLISSEISSGLHLPEEIDYNLFPSLRGR